MRAYNRFNTDEMIDCAVNGERSKVALYNLSCGGCMIESANVSLQQDVQVSLTLRDRIEIRGRVAWRVGKNAGIKFEQTLHPRVVEQFGYEDEEFDRNDPRDRFGIPLVEMRHVASGWMG